MQPVPKHLRILHPRVGLGMRPEGLEGCANDLEDAAGKAGSHVVRRAFDQQLPIPQER